MKKLNFLWVVILATALLAGCKKNEVSDQNKDQMVTPYIAENAEIVKMPASMENSTNTYVSQVKGFAAIVNGYAQMGSVFAHVSPYATHSGNTWTYTSGQNTVWYEQTETTDGYTWKYYEQTPQTPKYMALSVTELKSKKGGSMKVYETDGTVTFDYNWSKNDAGVVTATILIPGSDAKFIQFTSNTDLSGTLKIYEGTSASGVLYLNYSWDSTGHGTYWIKDTGSGQIQQGTF